MAKLHSFAVTGPRKQHGSLTCSSTWSRVGSRPTSSSGCCPGLGGPSESRSPARPEGRGGQTALADDPSLLERGIGSRSARLASPGCRDVAAADERRRAARRGDRPARRTAGRERVGAALPPISPRAPPMTPRLKPLHGRTAGVSMGMPHARNIRKSSRSTNSGEPKG